MKIIRGPSVIEKFAIDAASTAIVAGALMTYGVTDETDRSTAIISGAAGAGAIGILLSSFAIADNSTPEDGLVYTEREIEMLMPGCQVAAELSLDAADDIAVTSFTGSTVTITSLEDDIDGGWLYTTVGPNIGHLGYIKTSSSGSCVYKTAPTTAPTSSSSVVKIHVFGHTLLLLTADRSKLATAAAVGTFRGNVLHSEIKYKGHDWERLNPTKHDNLTGLDVLGVQFRTIFVPIDNYFARIA